MDAANEALSRHKGDPKLVGLAALALYNAAHADMGAAATVAGGSEGTVAARSRDGAGAARCADGAALGGGRPGRYARLQRSAAAPRARRGAASTPTSASTWLGLGLGLV